MQHHIAFSVNGDPIEALCEADQTLLDVLRDELELIGTKEGCSTGDCGACSVTVAGPKGKREMPVEDVMVGPRKLAIGADEFVVSFFLPARAAHAADAYERFIPRTEMDIAVVGAGVNLTLDDSGKITDARVALGAVAPRPLLVKDAAAAIIGTTLDDEALKKLDAAAQAACQPINDKRGTVEYRTKVAGVLARRTAQTAYDRARNK